MSSSVQPRYQAYPSGICVSRSILLLELPFVGNRVKTLRITKTDKIYWEHAVLTSGLTRDKWSLDGVQLKN